MIDAELIKALQILALKACEEPNDMDVYNRICRQFSKDFNMPLSEVIDADPIWVLRNYFEDKYQALYSASDNESAQEYQQLRDTLLYPEEVAQKEVSDEEWIAELRRMNEENQKKAAPVKPPQEHNLVEDIPEEFKLPDSGSFGEDQ